MMNPLSKVRRRLRLVAAVPQDLHHPLLHIPVTIGATSLWLARRRKPRDVQHPRRSVQTDYVLIDRESSPDPVPVFLHTPKNRHPGLSGAIVWMHGGGFIMGAANESHALCARLADEAGIVVVSVDYRLAPEHPFPAALNDGIDVLAWIDANAASLGIDPSRIGVGGQSAGGGLAVTMAQRAYDEHRPVAFQALIYPMLDDRTAVAPTDRITVWNAKSNVFAWTCYLGGELSSQDSRPYISGARREDLTGLPPAWIGLGDQELFLEEVLQYAERLQDAGVPTTVDLVPGLWHLADELLDGKSSTVIKFRQALVDAVRTALGTPSAD